MGLFSKDIATLDDLFVHQLQDVYYAENQILKALPKMAAKATDPELKAGFERHLAETEGQIRRLEQIFQLHGATKKAVSCPAIDGIIKEANEVAGEIGDKKVLDAALIAWARQLGREDIAALLAETLVEERATDEKLTTMAEHKVNAQAELAEA